MELHHICIQTDCYEASLEFYTQTLDFELVKETPDFHTRRFNTWLRKGSFYIELQTPKAGDGLLPWSSRNSGPVHLCFRVADVGIAYGKLAAQGCRFKLKEGNPLYAVENGMLFKVVAPEGTEIEFRDTEI